MDFLTLRGYVYTFRLEYLQLQTFYFKNPHLFFLTFFSIFSFLKRIRLQCCEHEWMYIRPRHFCHVFYLCGASELLERVVGERWTVMWKLAGTLSYWVTKGRKKVAVSHKPLIVAALHCPMSHMGSVQKVSSHVIWKMETFIEEDTRYKKHCTQDNDDSDLFKISTLGPYKILPIAINCPIYFPKSHRQYEISSLSKVILLLGKARSHRVTNLGCRGSESPGWFDVLPKNSSQNMNHERVCCHDEAANHQLPIAAASWIIWIVSVEECPSLMQNLMQIHCCTLLGHFECDSHTVHMLNGGVYRPHWLVQWSHHCSRMHIPVHSPWLPRYTDVAQTVLLMLTIVGLFAWLPSAWKPHEELRAHFKRSPYAQPCCGGLLPNSLRTFSDDCEDEGGLQSWCHCFEVWLKEEPGWCLTPVTFLREALGYSGPVSESPLRMSDPLLPRR